MGGSCLAERLSRYVRLTSAEQGALRALEQQERVCRRGTAVISENEAQREIYIVQKGWLHSGVILDNGGRQIMRFHFPGDILGLSAVAFGEAGETVTAVTDVTLCPFGRDRFAALFSEQPRLAGLIFTLAVAERVALADRLASIGRTSARARVASLLCEIFTRMRLIHGSDPDWIHIPLTQEDLGDAAGLTAVHVNRMMRGLVEDGIIERQGNQVRLTDERRLIVEANFTDRSKIDTSWLPAAG